MRKFIVVIFLGMLCYSKLAVSVEYWDLMLPKMAGAINVDISKNPDTGIHTLSYDISLKSHTDPLSFYDSFFNENGWTHFMTDTYKKFPKQFEKPPNENWTSFAAKTENEKFVLIFGTLWQNEENKTNAQVTLKILELKGAEIKGHIDVVIAPAIDGSSLIELIQLTQKQPMSLLKLASLVGGDPFQLEEVDIRKIKQIESEDPIINKYKEAMNLVIKQYADFVQKHVPKN